MSHLFPDGQLYVDLHGFGAGRPRTASGVLAGFLADLDPSSGSGIPEHHEDRAALLRSILAQRRVLLVLDNAREASQVLPLLPGNGRCAVVVTSRNTLADLPGASQIFLGALDVEEQRALLSRLCGPERVRQDPDGALRLLAACAGLPLALRIIGARLASRPAWSMSTMAERLDDSRGRLQALSVGQLAVSTTFATSYLAIRDSDRPLEREAARAFRLLGLWSGHTLGVDAAAALLDRPPGHTADLLELLTDIHLLQAPDQLRYRFHDLLGEFAAQRVLEEESAEAREAAGLRLGIWYTVSLEAATAAIASGVGPLIGEAPAAPVPGFTNPQQALDWCRQEMPVIKQAIHRAAFSSRPDIAWRLAIWLVGYAHTYWWTGEWDACLEMALKGAQDRGDLIGQAWTLRRLATSHGMAQRNAEAIEAFEAVLAMLGQLGDDISRVGILSNLSLAYGQQGRGEQSLAYAQEAWKLQQQTGDEATALPIRASLAQAYLVAGDYQSAVSHCTSVLEMCRRQGNQTYVAITLANLGDALRGLGRRDDAFSALEESLAIRQRLGDMAGTADILVITGRAHAHFGQHSQAQGCYEQAVEIGRGYNMPVYIQQGLDGLEQLRYADL